MSSIQERLQLKRVPLDTWNIREQLCLASAVVRSGDQNWMSVSRALKTVGEPNRPPDWYSQKSCAAQYGALLEHVETPKRKKRCSEGAVETPQESIVKRLTQERIVEIQKTIAEMNQQYEQLKNGITEVRNQNTTEERLREIWSTVEAAKRARERESARRAAWLKEREEKQARSERTWRPTQPTSAAAPAPPSSPLLTSLLKSSPVVTTPQHLAHPASVVDTLSPSVNAPTLSMLLEKSSHHESKNAAIEHIKSQLVQIEQQLKANSSPPPQQAPAPPLAAPPLSAPPLAAPPVEIDDIEIKAEDVYVFRDIDLHLPNVGHVHKGPPTRSEVKPQPKKEEEVTPKEEVIKPEPEVKEISVDPVQRETEDVATEPVEETVIQESTVEDVPAEPEAPTAEPETSPAILPEVKFPTTEIKVIQEDMKMKEESREPEVTSEESQPEPEVVLHEKEVTADVAEEVCEEQIREASPQPPEPPAEQPIEPPPAPVELSIEQQVAAIVQQPIECAEYETDPKEIPLPTEPHPEEVPEPSPETEEAPLEPEPDIKPVIVEQPEVPSEYDAPIKTEDDIKKDEEAEDSIPLKQMIRQESLRNSHVHERDHTETDDDTPMEVSREEEKEGKKRKDYSRKKKSDSRTCSGSESACEASAGDSPHTSDADRQHRLWKKSVMLVYSRLCAHKYASLFLRPITDEEAPGYSAVVKRPMDLSTIRRNIDNGQIRNTAEFQRDVLLMLSNAVMYNSSEHSVFSMAKEMYEEAGCQLGMLLAAQAHAGLEAPPRRKRRRHDDKR